MTYIDQNGKTWTRSEDGLKITMQDGSTIYGNAQMTDEYLVSLYYNPPIPEKSDAERIAELEAQLAAIIASLNKPSS